VVKSRDSGKKTNYIILYIYISSTLDIPILPAFTPKTAAEMMAVDLAACGRRLAALALAESPRQLQEALATSVNFTVKAPRETPRAQ
jgi:hypothetical protein